jgi:hypothetical protein
MQGQLPYVSVVPSSLITYDPFLTGTLTLRISHVAAPSSQICQAHVLSHALYPIHNDWLYAAIMFCVATSSRLLQVMAFESSVFTPKIVILLLVWEWLGHINWFQCLSNFIRWLPGSPYEFRCYRISVISWFHHSSSEFDQWMPFALFWLTFSS